MIFNFAAGTSHSEHVACALQISTKLFFSSIDVSKIVPELVNAPKQSWINGFVSADGRWLVGGAVLQQSFDALIVSNVPKKYWVVAGASLRSANRSEQGVIDSDPKTISDAKIQKLGSVVGDDLVNVSKKLRLLALSIAGDPVDVSSLISNSRSRQSFENDVGAATTLDEVEAVALPVVIVDKISTTSLSASTNPDALNLG